MTLHVYFFMHFNSEIQGRNTSPLVQLTYTITLKNSSETTCTYL